MVTSVPHAADSRLSSAICKAGIRGSGLPLPLPFRLSQALRQGAGQIVLWAENAVHPAATFEQSIWPFRDRKAGFLVNRICGIMPLTEMRDAEVERIRDVCDESLFDQLFVAVTKYKLTSGATTLLSGKLPSGVPRNLRLVFNRAVHLKENGPRLRIERIESGCAAEA
jgi:hypothetical protein